MAKKVDASEALDRKASDHVQRRALRILKGTATFEDKFFSDHDELTAIIKFLRGMGCATAFVTGVWDVFHVGHGRYLARGKEEARKLCSDAEHMILVVGLDSDKLTRERKGENRPAVPEDERAETLGFLHSVDIVTMQYRSDQLYNIVEHDVRIVSQSTKDLPGMEKIKQRCSHVVNLPPQAETSTSAKLRKMMLTGGVDALKRILPKIQSVADDIAGAVEEMNNDIKS